VLGTSGIKMDRNFCHMGKVKTNNKLKKEANFVMLKVICIKEKKEQGKGRGLRVL
jgi:hypothetical protein